MGTDALKAKIMLHPLYPALLGAFIGCQKETYCDMLVTYSQELTRQIQEADHFFRNMEAHIRSSTLANGGGNCEGGVSSGDEQEISDVGGLPVPAAAITGPFGEGKEPIDQFLNKHSDYLSSLWRKLSRKKKKKGKLPSGERQKLLQWWRLNWRSPYPSELEKAALAESTGLDGKQINNWFINQRKRHWKPTPPAVEYRSQQQQPHYGASSSSSAAFLKEGHYFTGGSAYPPRGP